jgi:hypothetical protein
VYHARTPPRGGDGHSDGDWSNAARAALQTEPPTPPDHPPRSTRHAQSPPCPYLTTGQTNLHPHPSSCGSHLSRGPSRHLRTPPRSNGWRPVMIVWCKWSRLAKGRTAVCIAGQMLHTWSRAQSSGARLVESLTRMNGKMAFDPSLCVKCCTAACISGEINCRRLHPNRLHPLSELPTPASPQAIPSPNAGDAGSRQGRGTGLIRAAAYGHEAVVRLLIAESSTRPPSTRRTRCTAVPLGHQYTRPARCCACAHFPLFKSPRPPSRPSEPPRPKIPPDRHLPSSLSTQTTSSSADNRPFGNRPAIWPRHWSTIRHSTARHAHPPVGYLTAGHTNPSLHPHPSSRGSHLSRGPSRHVRTAPRADGWSNGWRPVMIVWCQWSRLAEGRTAVCIAGQMLHMVM